MSDRPEFEPHEYFRADDQGYISRKVFIEHVRSSYDHMRELAQMIKSYDSTLDASLENIKNTLDMYMNAWGHNLESLDDSIVILLNEWIDDGTFAHIINDEVFKTKADQSDLDTVTAQLAQTTGINIDTFEKETGEVNDTGRIQRAIDYAESLIRVNEDSWAFSQLPPVIIPEGAYVVDGLVISSPLTLKGISQNGSVLKSSGENKSIIKIRGLSKDISSTSMEDIKPRIENLSIIGTASSGYDNQYDSTMQQHGVEVDNSDTDYHYTRVELLDCNIRHCLGHGVLLGTSVSNKLINSNITLNVGDGVRMTGDFNTDIRILHCAIRRNRIGINILPTTNKTITTGLISGNVIESNRNGFGPAGSSTRPCVGIQMTRTQFVTIRDNYFERHLNDIYGNSNVSFTRIENNYFDGSSNLVPNYEGYTPIARKVCAIAFVGSTNISNVIEKNRLYKPIKPSNVSEEKWGTSQWGNTYEHLPTLEGTQYTQIIRNYGKDDVTTGQLEEITYKGAGNEYYENVARVGAYNQHTTRSQNIKREAKQSLIDISRNISHESETDIGYDIPKNLYIHPSLITKPLKRVFSSSERQPDGSLTSKGDAFGINGKGEFAIPFDKSLALQRGDADSYVRQYVRSAPHTTGDHNRGDLIWNTLPSAGGNVGWVCTATGSPGTWKEFGTIEP